MPLPRAIATFNRNVTNRVTRLVATRLPGFGIVTHQGRRSGRTYETPVNVFRTAHGFNLALTFGRGDWVKNVVYAAGGQVTTRGKTYRFSNPRIDTDARHRGFPLLVRVVLGLIHADDILRVDDSTE